MTEIIKLAESPLSLALVICAALVLLMLKVFPMLLEHKIRRAAQAELSVKPPTDNPLFMARFEAHAKRVHEMAGVFGEARRMVDRFDALEQRVETVARDSAAAARDLAELKGSVTHIQHTLDRLSDRLLGKPRHGG